eukprot:1393485-Prymnesium_polylepis.1
MDTYSARSTVGLGQPLVENVELDLLGETLQRELEEALSPLERTVLSLRYGLADGDALSWANLSERCGMPVKELQTLQARAFRRLRKRDRLCELQDLCHHAEWESQSDPL